MPAREGRAAGGGGGGGGGGPAPAGAAPAVEPPVRKERVRRSERELLQEAQLVVRQVDSVDCVSKGAGVLPEKFYTLPNRKKQHKDFVSTSLDRRVKRRGSLEQAPPKKPPRTFATVTTPPPATQKTSIFDIFKKQPEKPKKSNLRRSVSDASTLKSKAYGTLPKQVRKRSGSDTEDNHKNSLTKKKQLSPIIEVTQREDYFEPSLDDNDKENVHVKAPARKKNKQESVTEKLKEYIDEVDEQLYKETGIRVSPPATDRPPAPIIIDLDKAQKISTKKSKLGLVGKKLKSITTRSNKTNDNSKNLPATPQKTKAKVTPSKSLEEAPKKPKLEEKLSSGSVAPNIQAAIDELESATNKSPTMIHSSQKPADKLPLTKGRTVDTMVKRLSHGDSCSPPPKPNVMVAPNISVQHNNNQPFSYTRGISPEKYVSNENLPSPTNPIIYAQVVCGNNGVGSKQTVHAAYTNGKRQPHSDSDEGLGGEESSGFGRKYEHERNVTRFGDEHYTESYRKVHDDYFDEIDSKFKQESPIMPKYRSNAYRNNFESKVDDFSRTGFIDMSSRGRGDGMDAKRRESLSEENGFANPKNDINNLSARRDLLESRINRRINDKSARPSPEYSPTNVYVSETTSKYYRSGSTSPVGYKEKYKSEMKVDRHGERYTTESRSKKYFGDDKRNGYSCNNGFESEPKSFDSQLSDYRSSPENRHFEASHNRYNSRNESQKIFKDRSLYKSTPEIHLKDQYSDSYHDSLRREKVEGKVTRYKSERYLDQVEERKDKFGDSGIENDFRRDSTENYRVARQNKSRRDYLNESEDEGFASSLLIASEKQHTEDNLTQKKRRDYDSDRDRTHSREDDAFRHSKYVPRERSIDDGSHYDPRLDKELERSTMKRVDKKPPKPEKKSGLEKVKSLFTRDSKKKKEKQQVGMVREESLRARYVEYKGRNPVEPKINKKDAKENFTSYDYSNRRRLSTPSPSPTREPSNGDWRNGKPSETSSSHGGWFKSLDRISRKMKSKDDKDTANCTSTEDELQTPSKPPPTKSLRFFGDTDVESTDGRRPPPRKGLSSRSQSTRDLHNISEEMRTPDLSAARKHPSHKSLTNISEQDTRGSRLSLKPPASPTGKRREPPPRRDARRRRADARDPPESSTEGDSSQQSQRSVVYLHAATVGDIPDPERMRGGRRAASREELAPPAGGGGRLRPESRTVSRSFSVLAPWRPRHPRDALDIDYAQQPRKYEKGSKAATKDSSSTLKKKAQESRKFTSTLSRTDRKSRSKENLSTSTLRRSKEEPSKGSTSTLYKKKDRLPRENSRYTRDREDKKMSSKSLSVESLGNASRSSKRSKEDRDISRSISMPRDPEKSAGWFKMSKKSSRTSGSAQRL